MSKKRTKGALRALATMREVAKGWAETATENDEGMGHRDVKRPEDQPFVLADILSMIDDAEREVRTDPIPEPARSAPVSMILEAGGLQQSFLILSGDKVQVTLDGWIEGGEHGRRRLTVPVTIALRTA